MWESESESRELNAESNACCFVGAGRGVCAHRPGVCGAGSGRAVSCLGSVWITGVDRISITVSRGVHLEGSLCLPRTCVICVYDQHIRPPGSLDEQHPSSNTATRSRTQHQRSDSSVRLRSVGLRGRTYVPWATAHGFLALTRRPLRGSSSPSVAHSVAVDTIDRPPAELQLICAQSTRPMAGLKNRMESSDVSAIASKPECPHVIAHIPRSANAN